MGLARGRTQDDEGCSASAVAPGSVTAYEAVSPTGGTGAAGRTAAAASAVRRGLRASTFTSVPQKKDITVHTMVTTLKGMLKSGAGMSICAQSRRRENRCHKQQLLTQASREAAGGRTAQNGENEGTRGRTNKGSVNVGVL